MLHQYKYQGCAYVNAAFMMTKGRVYDFYVLKYLCVGLLLCEGTDAFIGFI